MAPKKFFSVGFTVALLGHLKIKVEASQKKCCECAASVFDGNISLLPAYQSSLFASETSEIWAILSIVRARPCRPINSHERKKIKKNSSKVSWPCFIACRTLLKWLLSYYTKIKKGLLVLAITGHSRCCSLIIHVCTHHEITNTVKYHLNGRQLNELFNCTNFF